MPEHSDETDTHELDAVFRGLVEDVATRGRRPRAELAVRAAGRRRTAAAAGALVLVLVVAAGVGGWVLQGSRAAVPAGPGTTTSATPPADDHDVPPPAPVTLDRLDEASSGWTTWEEGTADVKDVPDCRSKEASGPEPVGSSIAHYRHGARTDASLERWSFASMSDANTAMLGLVQAFDACPGTRLQNHDLSAELEVVVFTWGADDRQGAVWLVSFGQRVDVLHVAGVPEPSEDVAIRVSRLVAADVQVP